MNEPRTQGERLFHAAAELNDPAQRQAFLDAACGSNRQLRDEIESLLAHDASAGEFLDRPALHATAEMPASGESLAPNPPAVALEKPGMWLGGRYKLLEEIGEGGMGTVWIAEQAAPVKRKVALKLVKPGMDSRQVLARFDAERQALALMDHPHIAKVFDGGMTDAGRPYFVMEYVKGVPLTEYCDAAKLSPAERLQLFVPVCQAVQHAHQKGIVHRDLKPSNILVCLYDGKPVPKVIDFGLAKALNQSLTEQTLHTAHGLMVGTPLYMSPEQAEFNNLDIDTRSDVYSLGVILYELLTGSTPLEKQQFQQAALNEILRMIKEVDPPKPSTRVSGSASLPTIAAQRGIEPGRLRRSLEGDLDWIVMKALDKERSRRYETANALARDIERFLGDEAIEARPPSAAYRLRKFARKHRAPFATAGLVLVTLLAGVVVSSWQALRALRAEKIARLALADESRQRELAEHERHRAEQAESETMDAYRAATDEAVYQLIGAGTELGPVQRAYLEHTLKRWQVFARRQGDDQHSLAIQAEGYKRMADLWFRLGRYTDAVEAYRTARAIHNQQSAAADMDLDSLTQSFEIADSLAIALFHLGDERAATAEFAIAKQILERMPPTAELDASVQMTLAQVRSNAALVLRQRGLVTESLREFQAALEIQDHLVRGAPTSLEFQRTWCATCMNLASTYSMLGNYEAAVTRYQMAINVIRELARAPGATLEDQFFAAAVSGDLCKILTFLRRFDESRAELQSIKDHLTRLVKLYPNLPKFREAQLRVSLDLANCLKLMENSEAARAQFDEVRQIAEQMATTFPDLPVFRYQWSTALHQIAMLRVSPDESVEALQAAHDLGRGLVGQFPENTEYALLLANLENDYGNLLDKNGRPQESLTWLNKALDRLERIDRSGNENTQVDEHRASALQSRAHVREGLGDRQGAFDDMREALLSRLPRDQARADYDRGWQLLNEEKTAEANKAFQAGYEQRDSAVRQAPFDSDRARKWRAVYAFAIGVAMHQLDRTQLEYQWLAIADEQLVNYLKLGPDTNLREHLRSCAALLSLATMKLGLLEESLEYNRQHIELTEPNARLGLQVGRLILLKGTGRWSELVSEIQYLSLQPQLKPTDRFTIARLTAAASQHFPDQVDEYLDQAMGLLRKAIQAGYRDVSPLKEDSDLEPLRARPEFRQLLDELVASAAQNPG